jgi:signal transduction histidine kinase
VAGLGLEVVLAASAFGAAGTAAVALGASLALWIQQALLEIDGSVIGLLLQNLLLLATGAASAVLRRQWSRARDLALLDAVHSRHRLEELERRMEDLRRAGQVGANVARLAHGLKNAAGTMRGFASLIEQRLGSGGGAGDLVGGLRSSVDRLEEIAKLILDPPAREPELERVPTPVDADQVIERAIGRASVRHRDVEWIRVGEAGGSQVMIQDGVLDEILEVLMDNAAESMNGRGQVRISARAAGRSLEIRVSDLGTGLPGKSPESLFRPGRTTKETGSGFGLFVARQLAEALGGSLDVATPGGRGTSFRVTVPVAECG